MQHDTDFPLPWAPAPHAPWILTAANNRDVATFVAWNDYAGTLPVAEEHCRTVAALVNGERPKEEHSEDVNMNWNDLRNMGSIVVTWADSAMPNRTPAAALVKLYEEISEFVRNPTADELADIMILLVDLAHLCDCGDIGAAVRTKMKTNSSRKWALTPMGVMQHVDE